MKQLLTLAAVAIFAVATTVTARAQQAAPAPQASAEKPAAPSAQPAATAMKQAATSSNVAAKPKFTAEQIKDVQTSLQKQKLYTGKVTGVWSASTVKAYKAWQKANSLPVDGVLTEDAIAKLKAAQ
jgi:peptidoglycan hydrolase-like protein with peptidoglycan-binding domain